MLSESKKMTKIESIFVIMGPYDTIHLKGVPLLAIKNGKLMSSILKKNENYLINIDDLGHDGEGIGHVEGMAVFVEGGVPGDILKIKIIDIKKNFAVGKIIKVVKSSEKRVIPPCPVALVCGGCQLQHINYKAQLEIKTQKVRSAVERIGKIQGVEVFDAKGMENPFRYRNKAQFPVGIANNSPLIGFYKKGSHEIVDTESCILQHDFTDNLIKVIKEYIKQSKVSVYDERTGKGILRHIVSKVGFATGEIMVVVVTNGKILPDRDLLINLLIEAIPGLNSVVQNINTKAGNTILGRECITLFGSASIRDKLLDLAFNISPLSFFQVNPLQTEVLYRKVLEFADLKGSETVFDVYCGIGTISLFLAGTAKHVFGIEEVDSAIEDANENAKLNAIVNTTFLAGKAERVIVDLHKKGINADVIVVDPPRKGCDEVVLNTIAEIKPEKLIYVSCNPATLARDLRILEDKGYRTKIVQPVDLFPNTMHVECVVCIQKRNDSDSSI